MKVKILGVCSSPIKSGNTEYLLKKVLSRAEKEKDIETELVLLAGAKIKGCPPDCSWCSENQKEGKFCFLNDDMQELYPKVANSDAIVYGNPVYLARETWILRAFLDRLIALAIGNWYGFDGPVGGAIEGLPEASVQVAWFRHGGIETAMFSVHEKSMRYGMIPISPGFGFGIGGVSQAPSGKELAVEEDSFANRRANELGEKIAEISKKLKYGRIVLNEIPEYKLGQSL